MSAWDGFRKVDLAEPNTRVERRGDGSILVRSGHPMPEPERDMIVYLRRWAEATPDHPFMAARGPGGEGWVYLSYAEARARADALGQALLAMGLTPDRPILILSGNSLEHITLSLAAQTAGLPIAPLSPAYTLMSEDCPKVHGIAGLMRPGLIFAQSGKAFHRGIRAARAAVPDARLMVVEGPFEDALLFEDVLQTTSGQAIADAYAAVGPDTIAKYLFTSGSTGQPKGVINTQRMMTANQASVSNIVRMKPHPVYVDWLPWNHTFGGNFNVNNNLRLGGTIHLDPGRPVPGQFDRSVQALREIAPTYYSNVPIGWAMLVDELERDSGLRTHFFSRLNYCAYGGAVLPFEVWERVQKLAEAEIGERLVFVTGWGCTETAPTATQLHWPTSGEGAGLIGAPLPGNTIKMVPVADRYELRIKGPIVTPGYVGNEEATREAFDEEGYFRIGDAGRFVDEADPNKGLRYDGRVVEDFKLTSGTWVHVGVVRVGLLDACSPILRDAVICGHGRDHVAALAWLNLPACRERLGRAELSEAEAIADPSLRQAIAEGLGVWNAGHRGSSQMVRRVLLLSDPPDADAGEITDKGYINQRAVLERRADIVARLHAEPDHPDMIAPVPTSQAA